MREKKNVKIIEDYRRPPDIEKTDDDDDDGQFRGFFRLFRLRLLLPLRCLVCSTLRSTRGVPV